MYKRYETQYVIQDTKPNDQNKKYSVHVEDTKTECV